MNEQLNDFLQSYLCKKVVSAAYIEEIHSVDCDQWDLTLVNQKQEKLRTTITLPHHVSDVRVGWVLVRYSDGYLSASPRKAFDEGYDLIKEKKNTTVSFDQLPAHAVTTIDDMKPNHSLSRDLVIMPIVDSDDEGVYVRVGDTDEILYLLIPCQPNHKYLVCNQKIQLAFPITEEFYKENYRPIAKSTEIALDENVTDPVELVGNIRQEYQRKIQIDVKGLDALMGEDPILALIRSTAPEVLENLTFAEEFLKQAQTYHGVRRIKALPIVSVAEDGTYYVSNGNGKMIHIPLQRTKNCTHLVFDCQQFTFIEATRDDIYHHYRLTLD